MKVEVRLAGEDARNLEVPAGSKLVDLLKENGINREVVLVKVSGKVVPEEEPLKEGDRVEIFRIVTGG